MRTEEEIRKLLQEFNQKKEMAYNQGFVDTYFFWSEFGNILKWVLGEIEE